MTAPRYVDKETLRDIADTVPIPHTMPAQPFSRALALWLCRTDGCHWWNAPERTHCKECGSVRT